MAEWFRGALFLSGSWMFLSFLVLPIVFLLAVNVAYFVLEIIERFFEKRKFI